MGRVLNCCIFSFLFTQAGVEKIDSEEALIYEENLDEEDGVEGEMEESTKLKIFRRLAFVASKLKEFIGNMITTAGKVVVTILLGSSGASFQYWVEEPKWSFGE